MTDFDIQNHEPFNQLSAAGLQRRDEMMHELIADMRRLHRRRRIQRQVMIGGMAPIIAMIAIGLLWRGLSQHEPDAPRMTANKSNASSAPPLPSDDNSNAAPAPSTIVVRVQTDPTIVERWRAAPTSSAVIIDDQALLDTLAALDRPAGLIRSQGRLWLTRPVTDKEIHQPNSDPDNSSMNWMPLPQAMNKIRS